MRTFKEVMASLTSAHKALEQIMERLSLSYIIVGGCAVVEHGYERTTRDIDIIVSPEEFDKLVNFESLSNYGFEPTEDGLDHKDGTAVHLLIEGAPYIKNPSESVPEKSELMFDPTTKCVAFNDLIRLKAKRGRFKDLGDMQELLLKKHITEDDLKYIINGLSQSAYRNVTKVLTELEKEDTYYKSLALLL